MTTRFGAGLIRSARWRNLSVASRTYHTVAGFILDNLRRFPTVGEWFQSAMWRFEVADLDGLRIGKLIATRSPPLHRKLQYPPNPPAV